MKSPEITKVIIIHPECLYHISWWSIHPIVGAIFQCGPKWRTDRQIKKSVHQWKCSSIQAWKENISEHTNIFVLWRSTVSFSLWFLRELEQISSQSLQERPVSENLSLIFSWHKILDKDWKGMFFGKAWQAGLHCCQVFGDCCFVWQAPMSWPETPAAAEHG